MKHAELVRALWESMEAREWQRLAELLHPNFVLEWPLSNERIRGATNFVAVNQQYPGDWHIRILRIIATATAAASEVAVDIDRRTEVASSFYSFEEGQILSIREYWSEAYEAPTWREQWVEKISS